MSYQLSYTGAEIQDLLDFVASKVETELFSGDTTGTVTLSESAANFSELIIYYEGYNSNSPQTMTIDSPNGRTINLSVVEDSAYGTGGTRLRRCAYTISGTSITPTNHPGFTLINGTTVSQDITSNVIHITKVVGRG